MPQVIITLSPRHHQALKRKVAQVCKGTISSEIRKAIGQYLAGPRFIEAAFLKLLEQKAPKDLPVLLARFEKNRAQFKRDLREITRIRDWPNPLLNNHTPFNLLGSTAGVKRAMAVLNQKSRASQNTQAVTRKASSRHAEDPPRSTLGTKAGNTRVKRTLSGIKGSPLPVPTSLEKMKTFANRKAQFLASARKTMD